MNYCICGYEHKCTRQISYHKQECSIYHDFLKNTLTKEFFQKNIEIEHFSLYYICMNVLNKKIPYNIVVLEASKYGYKVGINSEFSSQRAINTKILLYGSKGGPPRTQFRIKNNGKSEVVSRKYIEKTLSKEFFDHYIGEKKMLLYYMISCRVI